jgi:prepilin-type N-terminal cleavage/methylation domain-containing protein
MSGRPQITIRRRPPRAAFTLIEVLIVVVIMAVLAGVVITRYFDTSTDAKRSVIKHNLHILRSQIGLYHISHPGQYPELVARNLPQLTCATNHLGTTGAGGPAYPYGPYVDVIPNNPFNNSSKVAAVAKPRQTPTAPADDSSGWQYDETTGNIWPNHPEYFN